MRKIKGISAWVAWAVRNKRIVYGLVLAGVLAGIWGTFRMNKDEFPRSILHYKAFYFFLVEKDIPTLSTIYSNHRVIGKWYKISNLF